jgi:hypothetical protein
MAEIRFVFSALVFLIILGWLLSSIANISFALLNPITIGALSVALIAVVAAGNTPIVKGGAMAIVVGIMILTFFIDFPYVASYWGILMAPIYITFIIALASLSK